MENKARNTALEVKCERPDFDAMLKLLDQQNERLLVMFEKLKEHLSVDVYFPDFDPDTKNSDAKAWIAMAEMCMGDGGVSILQLKIALKRALKGTASAWLKEISLFQMNWTEFKAAFLKRFENTETTASFLIKAIESKPNDNENMASWALRFCDNLIYKWKNATKEEIAVSLTMAHLSKFDPKVRQLTFTTDIRTRYKMLEELRFCASLPSGKCYTCGKHGHKAITCPDNYKVARSAQNQTAKRLSTILCFKCHKAGHIAKNCNYIARN